MMPGRHCLIMKTTLTKITTIKKRTMDELQKIWAETVMTGLLVTGTGCLYFLIFILLARLSGLHSSDGILLIPDTLSPLFIIAAVLLFLTGYLVCIPLYFGIRWFFWQAAEGRTMPMSSLFACYSSKDTVIRCIKLKLSVDIRKLLILAVLCVPMFFAIKLAQNIWESGNQGMLYRFGLIAGCAIVTLSLAFLFILLTARYIPVGYFLADSPDSGTADIIEKSVKTVQKKHTVMMMTYLSCWRTFLTGVFVLPVIFIVPYLYMVTAVFIHECTENEHDDTESMTGRKEHQLA